MDGCKVGLEESLSHHFVRGGFVRCVIHEALQKVMLNLLPSVTELLTIAVNFIGLMHVPASRPSCR